MSKLKRTPSQLTSPLPVMSPLQPDIIDADKVPIKKVNSVQENQT